MLIKISGSAYSEKIQFPRRIISWGILILLFRVIFGAADASANDTACPLLAPWFAIKTQMQKDADTVQKRADFQASEFQVRESIAKQIFKNYQNHSLDLGQLNTCLASEPDKQNFLNTLQSAFYEGSLEALNNSKSPTVQRLLNTLRSQLNGQAMLFRMINHYESAPDLVYKAGFYRGARSIFMNTDKIPANEWLLIFAHELTHSLDETLWASLDTYSQEEWVKSFADWSKKTHRSQDLPSDIREKLNSWLSAGLDRGLWAEYRAWYVTLVIYMEGRQSGAWGPIGWADKILALRNPGESTAHLTYRYLDARFDNPTEGIFSLPLISQSLLELRASYRRSEKLPDLGSLQEIVGPNPK
jgi:hypothetical protein